MADETTDPDAERPPSTYTPTYYRQLADYIVSELDRIAALIPLLTLRPPKDFVLGHQNVPLPFMQTITAQMEDPGQLAGLAFDVTNAHDTLQYLEAFRTVAERYLYHRNMLLEDMRARKAILAAASLQIYAVGKRLAKNSGDHDFGVRIAQMGRALGKRGRPRKKKAEDEPGE